MALVATYYWNESLVRFIFAEDDWNKTRRIAKKLCAKAVKLDKTVVKRWPFVGAVVGKPKGRKESPFGNNQRKAKRPERSATTKSKLKPPPGRPAGFQFGISPEEAKAACVLEGHRFKETSGRYECSGAAMETAFAQTTSLEFCEDELCRIDSRSQPSQRLSKPWLQRFAAIKRHYVSRYGKPKRVRFKLPNRCKKEILPCLKDGKAAMIYSWRWPARKLTLSMGRIDGEATIRVSHEMLGEAD